MKGAPRAPFCLLPTLNFMSINVGRGGSTQDIALSRAYELGVDVLLIQEPLWNKKAKETRSHPGYTCHIPYGGVEVRPRAVTYTRKNDKVKSATQIFPCATLTGDYCWVVVNGITFFNVYKAPSDSTAIRPLVNWTPARETLAIGDFNAVHEAWQPGANHQHGQGEEIERWAAKHNLSCLIIGEPTHRAGNTLDLAWTNISSAAAWVDRSECVTSDHLPIRGQVPLTTATTDTEPPKIRVPRKNIPRFVQAVAQWVHPPPTLDTTGKVEAYAQDLCLHLFTATQATGTRARKSSGRSAPWWTSKCKSEQAKYRTATTPSERATCAKELRAAVRAAKKEHTTRRVEAMNTPADIFKLMRAAEPRQARTPPPLQHEGSFVTDPAERAAILRDALLARHDASDDLPPPDTDSDSNNRIPWNDDISDEEVRTCTIGCGNTTPGADGVSVQLLEACWETIGPYVTQLFRACIQLGTHPSCFKLAEVVLLPKPNRDPSTVKGWRPIALLSCLGKGLERLLAKRMAHLAVVCDVVGHQQFGALPKRSATDLVSCVVHDIEEARTQGWAATFVTLDVQGAFDAVLHNRLVRRMKTQGWPDSLLRWTSSFLAHRQVQVRYTGGVTTQRELACGVPQGSPISPLLFLLYMAEPMCSGTPQLRFSYADDVGILGFGTNVAESAAAAQREVDHLLEWARNNAVAFDTAKSEVIQFPGKPQETATAVGVQVNGTLIEPAEHIRWLGVHLDPRLNFKHHVTTWCGKALKVAHHMRRFNTAYRGAAPGALVRAVETCIVSVATYGSDVWWPGLRRPTIRGTVTPQTTNICNMMDKAILTGLRAALPVMWTTPTVVVHREGGIPPAKYILEGNRLRLAARLKSLDDQHPLRSRAATCPNEGTKKYKKRKSRTARPDLMMSRVQRTYRELPEAEPAGPLPGPGYLVKLGNKEVELEDCKRWLANVPASEICAYPDGSSEGHGRSSWAFVLKRDGRTILTGRGIVHGGEVLDAEIVGARKALEAALKILGNERQSSGSRPPRINIVMDSQQARKAILTGNTSSSSSDVDAFRSLSRQAQETVLVRWIPGHSGIQGNEEADTAARATLRDLPDRDIEPQRMTSAYLFRLMKQKRQALLDQFWEESCPPKYRALDLLMRRRKPPELGLPRRLLLELIAARTGHGNFATYHRRFDFFKNSDAQTECSCGSETHPTHFIHCRRHAHYTRRLRGNMPYHLFVKKLLGPNCHKKFATFAQETDCFVSQPAALSTALSVDQEESTCGTTL